MRVCSACVYKKPYTVLNCHYSLVSDSEYILNVFVSVYSCVRVHACVRACVRACVNREPSLYEAVIIGWSVPLSQCGLITTIQRRLKCPWNPS